VTAIGVHTPETEGEKNIEAVQKKVRDKGMNYAVAVDSQGKTWAAWGNRWWPSISLIDKNGNVRCRWDGELNGNKVKGEEIMRQKIKELVAEKG
jgi:hypothetical protein